MGRDKLLRARMEEVIKSSSDCVMVQAVKAVKAADVPIYLRSRWFFLALLESSTHRLHALSC